MISINGEYRVEFHEEVLKFWRGRDITVVYLNDTGYHYHYVYDVDTRAAKQFDRFIKNLEKKRKGVIKKKRQKIGRIIFSPFIFLYGVVIMAALTAFPFAFFIIIYSVISLIAYPFILLLRPLGTYVDTDMAFFSYSRYDVINLLLDVFVHITFPTALTYYFIKDGTINEI